MTCMKCGRAIALGQAFCKDCLEDMSHYPVNPGTPVQIPVQPAVSIPRRNPRVKKTKKPEEQIIRLRKIIRFQILTILLLLALLTGLGIFSFLKLYPTVQPFRPGENYITTEVTQHSSTATP